MTGDSKANAKFKRMVLMCVLVVLPYTLFMIMLGASPATLASTASGSIITLAIYFAILLFLWPIVMAVIFVKGGDKS